MRDTPPTPAKLLEAHWSYMDRYAAEMIARGPTLADDGDTPAGGHRDPRQAHRQSAGCFAAGSPTGGVPGAGPT